MRFLFPNAAPDPRVPQWWIIAFTWHRQKRFRYLDLFLRLRWVSVHLRWKAPTDTPRTVGRTFYDVFYIVHPNGGSVCRLRCQSCGADYPWPKTYMFPPCGFCAVERETKVRLWWGRREPKPGETMYKRFREWPAPPPINPEDYV